MTDDLDALIEVLKRALRPAPAPAVPREGYGLEGAEIAPAAKSAYERTLSPGEWESLTKQERNERLATMAGEAALGLSAASPTGRAAVGEVEPPRAVGAKRSLDERIASTWGNKRGQPAAEPLRVPRGDRGRVQAARLKPPADETELDLHIAGALAKMGKGPDLVSGSRQFNSSLLGSLPREKAPIEPPPEFVARVAEALGPGYTEASILKVAREAFMRGAPRRVSEDPS
jgi:hypothetical protein